MKIFDYYEEMALYQDYLDKQPKLCKYCGEDVSTHYKATHNEVEFINGLPSPCRNNGQRNVDIAFDFRSMNRKTQQPIIQLTK